MVHYNFSSGDIEERRSKHEYAVVIYLPPPLEQIVTPLRAKFDPDYDLVAAHLSLVFPWKTERSIEEISAELSRETSQWESFTVELGTIGDFYPQVPIIYWEVENADTINRLYRRLYHCLDQALPFKDLIPHVTVAKEISPHRVMLVKDHIASYVRKEIFPVTAIDLISPVADRHWVSVRTFPIKAG